MDLKNRMELAASFSGVGVEIGVENGKFSAAMLTLGNIGHLYSIDPWLPIPEFFTPEQAELAYLTAGNTLSAFYPRSTIIRHDAREVASRFPSLSLDFVYIDSSHDYGETYDELLLWYDKLKSGGILSGHDYVNGPDVQRAVNQFANENSLKVETTEADTDLPFDFHINSWIIRKP